MTLKCVQRVEHQSACILQESIGQGLPLAPQPCVTLYLAQQYALSPRLCTAMSIYRPIKQLAKYMGPGHNRLSGLESAADL